MTPAGVALWAALALWAAPAGAEPAAAGSAVLRVHMQKDRADYFLSAPAGAGGRGTGAMPADIRFVIDASAAPPKARILLLSPLPAGPHRLHLQVSGARARQTFVIALPVQRGDSTFDVRIDGPGRYDFGFWAEPVAARNPEEYRFTVMGPVRAQRFTVAFAPLPAARW